MNFRDIKAKPVDRSRWSRRISNDVLHYRTYIMGLFINLIRPLRDMRSKLIQLTVLASEIAPLVLAAREHGPAWH